jgi:signal transduction histidine kinase
VKAKSRKGSVRPDSAEGIADLRAQLADAQATLRAIRNGEVDAVVVESTLGPKVYTLDGAEFDYRMLIESMNEGALVLTRSALILYANTHFAEMVDRPLAQLVGSSLFEYLSLADQAGLARLMKRPGKVGATSEVLLQRPCGAPMAAKVFIRRMSESNDKNVSIGMVVSDMTESRSREDLLRRFSQGLMQMQETERLQVATELGDNIAQLLCSILVRCQLLADRVPAHERGLKDEASEFAKLLRTTASEVHRMSGDLRPHGLEILGLVQALRSVVTEFADRMGVPIEVNCAKMTDRLPPAAEMALYRVLQEALRNVEQHSGASHVSVALRKRGSVVQLEVRDDGVGFDTSDQLAKGIQAGQFGLLSMRERAMALGGTLTVKSTAPAGTQVHFKVPLSPKPEPV